VLVSLAQVPLVGGIFRGVVAVLGVGLVAERAHRAWRTS